MKFNIRLSKDEESEAQSWGGAQRGRTASRIQVLERLLHLEFLPMTMRSSTTRIMGTTRDRKSIDKSSHPMKKAPSHKKRYPSQEHGKSYPEGGGGHTRHHPPDGRVCPEDPRAAPLSRNFSPCGPVLRCRSTATLLSALG